MDESPIKNKPTSRVIDSLHTQIDTLKTQLETIKSSNDDFKKKNTLLNSKNESFVDQLANAKHENDMINALLKRKERRITDLEDQFNELTSTNESLAFNNKNMKIRCENLQESSATSIAEFERLKISYDALITSQAEYKRYYQKEVKGLTDAFDTYKSLSTQRFTDLSEKLTSNDKDVDTLLDSLSNKRKTMDNLYVNKNKLILDLLSKLGKAGKIHGEESKIVLKECLDAMKELLSKYPDLEEKLKLHEGIDIDLEKFLGETEEVLEDEMTLINSPDLNAGNHSGESTPNKGRGGHSRSSSIPGRSGITQDHSRTLSTGSSVQRASTIQSKRRKNKRNSIRFDSKTAPDFSSPSSPLTTQLNLPKRPNMSNNGNNMIVYGGRNVESTRTPTPPEQAGYEYNGNYQFNQWSQGGQANQAPGNYSKGQVNQPATHQGHHQSNNYSSQIPHNGNTTNNRAHRNSSNGNSINGNHSYNNFNNTSSSNNAPSNPSATKKFNRRSTYGSNNNTSNYNKRNSQSFEPNSLNLALNT